MARADLLKKLFSSFKQDDKEAFNKIANEIIEDERKKNHGILADDLKMILSNNNLQVKRPMSTFVSNTPKDNDKDAPLAEVIYPEKYFSDLEAVLIDVSANYVYVKSSPCFSPIPF